MLILIKTILPKCNAFLTLSMTAQDLRSCTTYRVKGALRYAMLVAKLTFRNIGNRTKVFEAPQPPILGEPGLKVPQNCYPLGKSSRNSDRDDDSVKDWEGSGESHY